MRLMIAMTAVQVGIEFNLEKITSDFELTCQRPRLNNQTCQSPNHPLGLFHWKSGFLLPVGKL